MKFRKSYLLLLSVLAGLILSVAWPVRGFPFLLFLGFIPLLVIEETVFRNPGRFIRFSTFFLTLPAFLLWNLLTTWWIVNSTLIGALLAIVLNSIFMAIVFQAFHWTRKKLRHDAAGYLALLSYWISFEYLHLNWDLNWPWLNLGNGFAAWYKCVQWYEYTGAPGGTLWVLAGNMLLFILVRKPKSTTRLPLLLVSVAWIVLPVLFSLYRYFNYSEENRPVSFVVVQPNIDPYSEQYSLPPQELLVRILELAREKTDSATNFLVAPESAIQEGVWENELSSFSSIRLLREAIAPWPRLNLLIGASTFYQVAPGEPLQRWARKFTDTDNHYYAYNAAILINNRDSLQVYHKSRLTPGVEILPSFKGFTWLENYAIDLGGTVGSLGMDSVRKVYTTVGSVAAGPAICYESIFGEFFAEFVRNGAQIMIIITNDGWWGNTAGHRQHFVFAHLRAIETRRSIARSANTGISALIDQRGDAHQETPYWKPAVIKGTLNANAALTFYVKHGDYIARFFSYLSGAIFMAAIAMSVRKRYFKLNSKIRPR